MKNLFTLAAICGFSVAVVSAETFLDTLQTQTLAEDNLDLASDSNLACGGCIRSGYMYCRTKSETKKGRDPEDRCCKPGDTACMYGDAKNPKDNICSTLDAKFYNDHKDRSELYKDPYVMMQKFCMKRQNKTACCPKKNKTLSSLGDDDGNCEIDLKKKDWTNYTIFLDDLQYGGSCTYEVKARCGFPKFSVNSTNIDMVVAFKRKDWGNDTYSADDDEKYDDNETFNPKSKNGKLEFWLQRREKPDEKKDDDDDDKKKCKESKIYLTLTNLLSPNRPNLT
jgi:hypothetical protein